jgi:hypothetical protein
MAKALARSLTEGLRRRRVLRRRRPPEIEVGGGTGEPTVYYLCPN